MKKIKDFPYSICSDGRCYSHHTNRFRACGVNNRGYLSYILYDGNGTNKQYLVHRLVAEYFIPNPDNLPCVNHKDGNKANNDVSNLEWVSYLDNNIHAIETGLRVTDKNTDYETATKVISYIMDGWRLTDIADALGLTKPQVRHFAYDEMFSNIREDFDWDNRPNKSATISDSKVIRICELLEEKTSIKDIAKLTGITERKISRIKSRETYRLISQNFNF